MHLKNIILMINEMKKTHPLKRKKTGNDTFFPHFIWMFKRDKK